MRCKFSRGRIKAAAPPRGTPIYQFFETDTNNNIHNTDNIKNDENNYIIQQQKVKIFRKKFFFFNF